MPIREYIFPGDVALDASARTTDAYGRMHISKSHISKAGVNPYYGREIPGAAKLGLEPDKIYRLLRSPDELRKAAPSFALNQLLSKHIPVDSTDHRPGQIVGTIGSNVEFNDPYLDADTCIWSDEGIANIETDVMREFSCSYGYDPVMTPGTYQGEPYDGIMTNIRGNHLAQVEAGRAGSDVVAADSKPFKRMEIMEMTKRGKALFVALGAAFPTLAKDAALSALVGGATKKTFDKAGTRAKLLAMDSAIPPLQLDVVMDAIIESADDPEPKEPKKKTAEDEETEEEKKKREEEERKKAQDAEEAETEEERKERLEKRAKDKKAKDAEPDKEKEKKSEKAMDARIDALRTQYREADEAKSDVRSTVGDVIAQDSAESIYAFALDTLKVDHAGVTGVPALKALYRVASSKSTAAPRIAMDAAAITTKIPGFDRVRVM